LIKNNTKVEILKIWLRYPDILVNSWSSVAAVGLAGWAGDGWAAGGWAADGWAAGG